MGNAVFRGMPAPRPLDRLSKKLAQLITSGTPPHTQELGSIGSKGACLDMREIVTLGVYFFFSFFNGPCALLQVGPLDQSSPLTAQMTRSGGHYVLFMVSLIRKNIFPYFLPKNMKNCITPYGNVEQL